MMEMIDNPISGKRENIDKTQRISFTDVYSKHVESSGVQSSGVTLGLILKEYCEFKVMQQ